MPEINPFRVLLAEENALAESQISAAYREKGSDCLSVIPDTLSVIVRDVDKFLAKKGAFSTAPVYYHFSSAGFFCGFTMKAVLGELPFSPVPDAEKIFRYFSFENELAESNHLTFFREVRRLMPGEGLSYIDGNLKFITCDAIKSTHSRTFFEEHVDAIRERFIRSVEQKINGRASIAANLSGGLDSSAVTCVAQSLRKDRVLNLYIETHTREADEFGYARKVSEKHRTNLRKVNSEPAYFLEAVKKVIGETALPETSNVSSALNLGVLNACAGNQVDTLLSGLLGDQVIDYGSDYFDELADRGEWYLLGDVLTQHGYSKDRQEMMLARIVLKQLRRNPNPAKALALWKELRHTPGLHKKKIAAAAARLVVGKAKKFFSKEPVRELLTRLPLNIERNFVKMHDPVGLLVGDKTSETARRITRWVYQHVAVEAIEQAYLLYQPAGISVRYPFFDKKLMETTFLSENAWKMKNGKSRATLREALKSYYPEEVYNRRSKAVFTTYLIEAYRQFYGVAIGEMGAAYRSHEVWRFCDRGVFEQLSALLLKDAVPPDQKNRVVFMLNRVLYLALWLDYLKSEDFRAVVKAKVVS